MSQGGDDNDEPACCPGRSAGRRVPAVVERWAGAAEVALRCTACGLAVLAAALLGGDRQARVFFSSYVKVARYTDIRALVLLVIANGIAACYSLVQGARCLVSTVRGSVLLNRPLAWAIFSCDQLMAYFTISAMAVALEAAIIAKHGQPEFQWIKTCIFYKRFCAQAGGAVACAVMSSVIMVAVAVMSAFNLFRLYGRGTGRK